MKGKSLKSDLKASPTSGDSEGANAVNQIKVLSPGEDLGKATAAKVSYTKRDSKVANKIKVLSLGEDLGEANTVKVSPTGGDLEGANKVKILSLGEDLGEATVAKVSPTGGDLEVANEANQIKVLSFGEDLGEATAAKVTLTGGDLEEAIEANQVKVLSFGEDLGEANTANAAKVSPTGGDLEEAIEANQVKVPSPGKDLGGANTATVAKVPPTSGDSKGANQIKVLSLGEDLGEANTAKVSPTGGGLEGAIEATPPFAAIFDMDGTLIDNTPYHFKSWQALFKKYGKGKLTKEKYYTEISGVPVFDTIRNVFGADNDEAGLKALLEEKEAFYRAAYGPHVAPINGLENFLTALKNAGIKMAMATSATIQDVDFILDHIPIRADFNSIVNSSMVSKPKPNPDIFLKAAEKLNTDAVKCIVFEDSLAGIKAGNAAGMKVVGITTGHPADKLKPTDLVISDYATLTVQKLSALFEKHKDE